MKYKFMKVWITKYALTEGIIEADATLVGENIVTCKTSHREYILNEAATECCLSKEKAIERADEIRKVKIHLLKKQIEKLEKMKFE